MYSKDSLADYLSKFSFQNIVNSISAILEGKNVIIYGASEAFCHVFDNYDFSKLNIVGIVDIRFKDSGLFLGHKKYSPSTIPKKFPFTILMATLNIENIKNHIEKNLYPKYGHFPLISLFDDYYNKNLALLSRSTAYADPKKVILGSADTIQKGWISTDSDYLDITKHFHWSRLFDEASIDNLVAEHVFEHIPLNKIKDCLKNIHKYLKLGGKLRFVVPDGNHPASYYREMTKPGGWGCGANDHKVFFTLELLEQIVNPLKYVLDPIEYFDSNGIFHKKSYLVEDGFIKRTANGYPTYKSSEKKAFMESITPKLREQFIDNEFAYTSLFVDIIKI